MIEPFWKSKISINKIAGHAKIKGDSKAFCWKLECYIWLENLIYHPTGCAQSPVRTLPACHCPLQSLVTTTDDEGWCHDSIICTNRLPPQYWPLLSWGRLGSSTSVNLAETDLSTASLIPDKLAEILLASALELYRKFRDLALTQSDHSKHPENVCVCLSL